MERPRTSPNRHPLALPMGPIGRSTPRHRTHPQHRRLAPQQSPPLLNHQILQRPRSRRRGGDRPTRTRQPSHGLRRTLRRILARQTPLAAAHPSPRYFRVAQQPLATGLSELLPPSVGISGSSVSLKLNAAAIDRVIAV
jgi:hypothetical protein